MTIARIQDGEIAELKELSLLDIPAHKRFNWLLVTGLKPPYNRYCQELSEPTYELGVNEVKKVWFVSNLPLAGAKENVKTLINSWKRNHQDDNFVYNGWTFQGDSRSRLFIVGYVAEATLSLIQNTSWNKTFTDSNNVAHELTATQMIELGKAHADRIAFYHSEAKRLKEAVDIATTIEELIAVIGDLDSVEYVP